MKGTLASLATTVALVAAMPQNLQVRDGITPAVIKGNAFFVGDNRFYLRGVDYQPGAPRSSLILSPTPTPASEISLNSLTWDSTPFVFTLSTTPLITTNA